MVAHRDAIQRLDVLIPAQADIKPQPPFRRVKAHGQRPARSADTAPSILGPVPAKAGAAVLGCIQCPARMPPWIGCGKSGGYQFARHCQGSRHGLTVDGRCTFISGGEMVEFLHDLLGQVVPAARNQIRPDGILQPSAIVICCRSAAPPFRSALRDRQHWNRQQIAHRPKRQASSGSQRQPCHKQSDSVTGRPHPS